MDAHELAQKISTALVPYLSQANAPADVNRLRGAIESKVKGDVVAESAWNDFAKTPSDEDNAASFRKELKKLIAADADFALQLMSLVSQVKITHVSAGQGGVAVGGDVKGSIVMGNNNTVVDNQTVHHQSGGVNIADSDVKVEGDLVGRDKK
jgi:hypothetical protein